MASKLSSILVKLGLIPIRKLDQAFQNQVIHGGTLDSALLELGLIREKDLIRVLVEASGLPSIQPADIVPENIRELVSLFPQKLALRYQVIPVTRVGSKVGVLVNAEFDKNKIDEIGFMLGVGLVARVVPEPRLMHFASVIYGVSFDERQARILDRIGHSVQYPEDCVRAWDEDEKPAAPAGPEDAGEGPEPEGERTPTPEFRYVERAVAPEVLVSTITREHQTGEMAKAAPSKNGLKPPAESRNDEDEEDIHQVTTRPGFSFPGQHRPRSPFSDSGPVGPLPEVMASSLSGMPAPDTGVRQIPDQHQEPAAPPEALAGTPAEEARHGDTIQMDSVPEEQWSELAAPTANEVETAGIQDNAPAEGVRALSDERPRAQEESPAAAMDKTTREHVVSFDGSPLSLNEFSALLATANHRDDMLVAFLRFCTNYAQYAFLFTVDQEAATGRFAIYRSQVDQHNVRNYFISLTFDSILKTAAQNIPVFGVYAPSEGNQFLLDYLGLSVPMHIMAIPVSVGARVVAIALGTHSLAQSPASIGEVTAAAGLLGQALLRLIKQKKTQAGARKTASNPPERPVAPVPDGIPRQNGIPAPGPSPYTAVTVPIQAGAAVVDSQTEEIIALIDQLEHLSIQQDQLDMRAATALMARGERTLEVLRFYFPGIITYRELTDPALAPPPREQGPLLQFMVHWGLPVVPVLVNLLDSDNPQIRLYATYLFQEIRFPDILFRIAEKLFDPDPLVREVAAWVILSYEGHREYAEITSNLRGFLSHPDPAMQKNAIDALGRLRDKFAVEPMLQLLPTARAQVAGSFIHALRRITLRDFGNHVDRWQSWWAINSPRHRILWLIEGLRQDDEELRRDALRELKRIVGETFDYDPSASIEQREAAVRRAVAWWDQQGRHQWL